MELEKTMKLKKNMVGELDRLEEKAYEEGKKIGFAEGKAYMDCSWEKGVKDTIEFFNTGFLQCIADEDGDDEMKAVFCAILKTNLSMDMVETVRAFVRASNEKNDADESDETTSVKVGDVVLDSSGNECTVTNTDTHIHVVYGNGKTHKWKKTDRFTKVGEAATGKVIGIGALR